MKRLLACIIVLASCTKPTDVDMARPIKRDVTAPSGNIIYSTLSTTINATDNMGLKAIYYYENNVLSRTFTTTNTPGGTATNWSYVFSTSLTSGVIKIMVVDLAGNYYETLKIIY